MDSTPSPQPTRRLLRSRGSGRHSTGSARPEPEAASADGEALRLDLEPRRSSRRGAGVARGDGNGDGDGDESSGRVDVVRELRTRSTRRSGRAEPADRRSDHPGLDNPSFVRRSSRERRMRYESFKVAPCTSLPQPATSVETPPLCVTHNGIPNPDVLFAGEQEGDIAREAQTRPSSSSESESSSSEETDSGDGGGGGRGGHSHSRSRNQDRKHGRNDDNESESEGTEEIVEEVHQSLRPGLRPRMVKKRRRDEPSGGSWASGGQSPVRRSARRSNPTERYHPPTPSQRQLARGRRDEWEDYYRDRERDRGRRRGGGGSSRRRGGSSRRRHGRRLQIAGGSTTEAEWSDVSDERYFEERRARSTRHARDRIQPMNVPTGADAELIKDRMRAGGKKESIEPMAIDKTVTFEHIGGLHHHVKALKEMIVFPLMYPEFFERFKMDPPRGVLFYGPPGTGKTLCARALANECSKSGKHVSFFMRKGADCLSKWTGESERMLRLLFDQAYKMRPSIIFFDEIDGLAPVRSSRTAQEYSSIVSTLLAMMDGLDSRGEVVVIGATNRPDNIDPALRRPGRFDREFVFPLPSKEARRHILGIHTKEWIPKLPTWFLDDLAERCEGYCGADLKALCTEAALNSLGRYFPEIYDAQGKIEIAVRSIQVAGVDFRAALDKITPAQQRSSISYAKKVTRDVAPLLGRPVTEVMALVARLLPEMYAARNTVLRNGASDTALAAAAANDIYARSAGTAVAAGSSHYFESSPFEPPVPHYARLLVTGGVGSGQTSHLCPAVLSQLEKYPVRVLDLTTLHGDAGHTTPEEACVRIVREVRRTTPSVLFLPRIDAWWGCVSPAVQAIIALQLDDIGSAAEVLVLASADEAAVSLPPSLQSLFDPSAQSYHIPAPTSEERSRFFTATLAGAAAEPPELQPVRRTSSRIQTRGKQKRELKLLPEVIESARVLSAAELKQLEEHEERTVRKLRMYLRNCLDDLLSDKKFKFFREIPSEEELPDYRTIVKRPESLSDMLEKCNACVYDSVPKFLAGIKLIHDNAVTYNPYEGVGKKIRLLAADLLDTANNLIDNVKDEHDDLLKECAEIAASRKRRKSAAQKAEIEHAKGIPAGSSDPLLQDADSSGTFFSPVSPATIATEPEIEPSAAPMVDDPDSVAAAFAAAVAPVSNEPEESGELVIDQGMLDQVTTDIIGKSARMSFEEMLELSSRLRRAIYTHQMRYDKTDLLAELNRIATSY